MFHLRLGLLALSAGLATATFASSGMAFDTADPRRAAFQTTDCWGGVAEFATIDCGWLTVPERWDRPGSKTLRLPVVSFKSPDPDPSVAPVIYLAGGPGHAVLGAQGGNLAGWGRYADTLVPGRTLVLFDQRGSGYGSPRLDCPEVKDPRARWRLSTDPKDFGDVDARFRAALTTCRDRLRAAGHDLGAYNSRQSAADVEALRHALGFEKIALLGVSYGTRLALTIMRHYPKSVSAAILDSVFPPQITWLDGDAYGATLDRLFAACAAYERCAKAYPNLKGRLVTLLDELAASPAVLEVDNLEGREPLYARIDHREFLEILRKEMYHTGRISRLPAMIAGAAAGELWRIRSHAENTIYSSWPRGYDLGMSFSVWCYDPTVEEKRAGAETVLHPHLNDYVAWVESMEHCALWRSGAPVPQAGAAVTSAVPSLLLAGGFDGSTPVEWAEAAAETLSTAHLFVFPAVAHVQIFNSPCARKILEAFLADPQTRPEPPCLKSLRKPAFLAFGGTG